MTKRMDGYARPWYSGRFLGTDKGALDAGPVHREGSLRSLSAASTAGREDQLTISMSAPVAA